MAPCEEILRLHTEALGTRPERAMDREGCANAFTSSARRFTAAE